LETGKTGNDYGSETVKEWCVNEQLETFGALVKEHAQEVAKTMGKIEFRASNR
jgi:hypothetical protein